MLCFPYWDRKYPLDLMSNQDCVCALLAMLGFMESLKSAPNLCGHFRLGNYS